MCVPVCARVSLLHGFRFRRHSTATSKGKNSDVKFSPDCLHRCSSRRPRWLSPCPSAPLCPLGCSTCPRSMSSSSSLSRTFRRGNEASRCTSGSRQIVWSRLCLLIGSRPETMLCCVVAGCRPGRQNVPEIQRKAERRDKDRTWQVAVRFHIYQVLMLLTVSPLAWSRIASSTGSDFFAPSP